MRQTVKVKPGALANALTAQNISLNALARNAHISKALAGALKQEKHGTSLDKAQRIATALSRNINQLFTHVNGDPITNLPAQKERS